jgi:anthranilate synthase component 1
MYRPSFEEFCRKSREGNLIPVSREILADMETPVSAFRKIDSGEYGFLLESVQGGEKWGRYSFLGSHPRLVVRTKGSRAELLRGGEVQPLPMAGDPLAVIKAQLAHYRPVRLAGLPRFFGGMVGYLGYDAARFFERLPDATVDDLDLPDACFLFTDTLLIFDSLRQRITVVSNAHVEDPSPGGLERGYEEAVQSIETIVGELRKPPPARVPAAAAGGAAGAGAARSTLTREAFEAGVRRCKEYVRAGDVIQAVLSRRLEVATGADPFDIYRALRIINPSPYMYYLRLGDAQLVGSSPEVLVRLEEGSVDLRPIAGTRPRGQDEAEDRRMEEELLADPKERAEHIMLVDLGRNDVGRVAAIGSVEVNELMVIERYSHVMHIVSNVRARLTPDRDAFDLLRACFPAGTVTGAPKIRAMEIIEELEPVKRGPYAGAVGYFSFSGNMDTCITIRTILCRPGRAYIQAGAGIVADSDPAREYQETASKAEAMLRAIAMAEAGLEG